MTLIIFFVFSVGCETLLEPQFFSAYLPKYFGFLQITSLLQFSVSHDNFVSAISGSMHQTQSETWAEVFSWLSILWKRGFCHDNPQGIDVLLA